MITDEDTTKIVNKVIEANKLLFYTKDETDGVLDKKFGDLNKSFADLQTAVMSFAVGTKTNAEEITVTNSRISKTEEWIK